MERLFRGKLLLLEMLISLLFLAISSTVITRLFLAAHTTSAESGRMTAATAEAQDWAERLYAADDPRSLLEASGFRNAEDGYSIKTDDGLVVLISLSEDKTNQGLMRDADICVSYQGEEIIEVTQRRYLPGEAD